MDVKKILGSTFTAYEYDSPWLRSATSDYISSGDTGLQDALITAVVISTIN